MQNSKTATVTDDKAEGKQFLNFQDESKSMMQRFTAQRIHSGDTALTSEKIIERFESLLGPETFWSLCNVPLCKIPSGFP